MSTNSSPLVALALAAASRDRWRARPSLLESSCSLRIVRANMLRALGTGVVLRCHAALHHLRNNNTRALLQIGHGRGHGRFLNERRRSRTCVLRRFSTPTPNASAAAPSWWRHARRHGAPDGAWVHRARGFGPRFYRVYLLYIDISHTFCIIIHYYLRSLFPRFACCRALDDASRGRPRTLDTTPHLKFLLIFASAANPGRVYFSFHFYSCNGVSAFPRWVGWSLRVFLAHVYLCISTVFNVIANGPVNSTKGINLLKQHVDVIVMSLVTRVVWTSLLFLSPTLENNRTFANTLVYMYILCSNI